MLLGHMYPLIHIAHATKAKLTEQRHELHVRKPGYNAHNSGGCAPKELCSELEFT